MLLNKSEWNEFYSVKRYFDCSNGDEAIFTRTILHALLLSLPPLFLLASVYTFSPLLIVISSNVLYVCICFVLLRIARYHFHPFCVHALAYKYVWVQFFLSQTNSNRMVVINTKLCFSFRNRLVNHGNCILCIRWQCLTHQQTFS